MSTLIHRRNRTIEEAEEEKYFSKSSQWWRILNIENKNEICREEGRISQTILDQVKLDVERSFCFKSGLKSR